MNARFEFDVTHKSGLLDRLTVIAESLRAAWRTAERRTGPATVATVQVRAPQTLGDQRWHSLPEAMKIEHISRTVS